MAENEDILYLIDYGLSKEYIDKKTDSHIPFMNNRGVVGTLRYISVVCFYFFLWEFFIECS
jgi:hypothetical protein